jgi:EPS-associated MarR family transcriptional regulator
MQEFHYKVLKILEAHPEISQRELARKLGMSLGKANYCMRALMEKGFVKVSRFSKSDSKSAYAYLLTPAGIEQKICAASYFLKLKQLEFETLEKEIQELYKEVRKEVQ